MSLGQVPVKEFGDVTRDHLVVADAGHHHRLGGGCQPSAKYVAAAVDMDQEAVAVLWRHPIWRPEGQKDGAFLLSSSLISGGFAAEVNVLTARRIDDPFEQSVFLLGHISYLQAFVDVRREHPDRSGSPMAQSYIGMYSVCRTSNSLIECV